MRCFLLTIIALLLTGPAFAQPQEADRQRCKSHDADTSIAGCTALIISSQETADNVAVAYLNRGIAYRDKDEFSRALRDFSSAIASKPAVAAFAARGGIYQSRKQFQEAIEDFSRALQLDPNDVGSLFGRGTSYFASGDYARARQDFEEVLKQQPHTGASRYRELADGWLRCTSGGPSDRIDGCAIVIVVGPLVDAAWSQANLAETFNNRGLGYFASAQFEQAIADFDRAGEIQPGAAAPFNNRGQAYYGLHNYGSAIAEFGRAIERAPGEVTPVINQGMAYAESGDFNRALAAFDRAVELNPQSGAALGSRAVAHFNLGQFDLALQDFDAATRIDSKDARSVYGRGAARLRRGDVSGSVDINAAKELQTDVAEVMARLGVSAPENRPSAPPQDGRSRPGIMIALVVSLVTVAGLLWWRQLNRTSAGSEGQEPEP